MNTSTDDLLGGSDRPHRRTLRWGLAAVALALLGAAGWALWGPRGGTDAPRWQTEAAQRGPLTVSVTANGTLQPTNQVEIGSELSGTVATVAVDINDRVERGQVLAKLDTARLEDQVAGSRAALAAARATLKTAEATRDEARAALARLEAVHQASGGRVPSATELDTARATAARALASVAGAEAGIAQAEAALRADETSLRKAAIRSPISGVVLSRAVDPGNAVAASLQAVTLFTLAEDLTKMKLQVNVDEADVGQVRAGQAASFTVAAWPSRRFPAQLVRVGYGPTTKDNVVTYLADLLVDNADGSLRPGMTATATLVTQQRDDVLKVPNAALRFTPPAAGAAATGGSVVSRLVPRPPAGPAKRAGLADSSQVRQVWVLKDGQPVAVPVRPGASDGRWTEVASEALKPGDAVIVGLAAAPK